MNSQVPDAAQMQHLEAMKKQLFTKILTKDAYERIARVRLANPQLAAQAEMYILQLFQAGKITGQVDDKQLKGMLTTLSEKKEINIKRR